MLLATYGCFVNCSVHSVTRTHCIPGDKVLGLEVDHSFPSVAEDKNQ